MSDIEREAFEKEFPVPTNVIWCGRGYASTDWGAGDNYKNAYDYMWRAWQAARQAPASGEVEPVAYLVECDGLRWAHAEHKDAEVQAMRLSADVTELFTHPPAKVPEKIEIDKFDATKKKIWERGWNAAIDAMLTTPTPATTPEAEWLIQLRGEYLATRGIWERPGHRGYTNDLHEAGRYSQEEAEKAEAMAPHKYKAVCLAATPPQEQ